MGMVNVRWHRPVWEGWGKRRCVSPSPARLPLPMSGIIPPEAAEPSANPAAKHAAGVVRLRRSMPLARFLQSLSGPCRYCGQQTGLLQRGPPECRQTHQAGFTEMVQLAAHAANTHTFNEAALRQTLQAIAQSTGAKWP